MSLLDIFNVSKIKAENEELKKMLTPEMQDAVKLKQFVNDLQKQEGALNGRIQNQQNLFNQLENDITNKRKQLIVMDEDILVQEFGLYKPKYDFENSDMYKEELKSIRDRQKLFIKNGTATTGNMNWTVNNSKAKGNKMVKDMQKLLLRAFNSECDELVSKVKYNNFDSCKKRIETSCNTISKLGDMMSI